MKPILPFAEAPKTCLSEGPSQGLVYAVDSEIVLKVPFQYLPTNLPEEQHCIDLTLRSFIALENEINFYEHLNKCPHPNVTRRLNVPRDDCLFLERLIPLQSAWHKSTVRQRNRWALELLSALSWLEHHGWCSGDLAVRNLGIDDTDCLKIFDFGSAIPSSHEDYANDMKRDRFSLATCLLFIFSGIDPLADATSSAEVKNIRKQLEAGLFPIPETAAPVAKVIKDGWLGHSADTSFKAILRQLREIFPEVNLEPRQKDESYYRSLEDRCQAWLRSSNNNPCWMSATGYVMACEKVGVEANLDSWR